MTAPWGQGDDEAAKRAQVVARRAIRRLDAMEWAIFAASALLATGGGALVAWILVGSGPQFRTTWVGASLLLFVVSGVAAIIKMRGEERAETDRRARAEDDDDG